MEPDSFPSHIFCPSNLIYYESESIPAPDPVKIPGLFYYPDYISPLESDKLLEIIDGNPWIKEIRRRQQHYGFLYYHTRHNLGTLQPIDQVNDVCLSLKSFDFLIERMINDCIFPKNDPPTQCLVNEYIGNHRIASHLDDFQAFGDVIAGLSLIEPCYMTMKLVDEPRVYLKFLMENRSLYVMKDDARYKWKHGITAMKHYDNPKTKEKYYRGLNWRRVSLTFRKILVDGTKKSYEDKKKDESCTW